MLFRSDAARLLGARRWRVFSRVTLPLSLPGLLLGFALVFTLTAGSFVTPAILGGTNTLMLGNLIEQQIFVVYDWPFGATLSAILIAIMILLLFTQSIFSRRALGERS